MSFSDSDLMKVIPETSHACTLNFLSFYCYLDRLF